MKIELANNWISHTLLSHRYSLIDSLYVMLNFFFHIRLIIILLGAYYCVKREHFIACFEIWHAFQPQSVHPLFKSLEPTWNCIRYFYLRTWELFRQSFLPTPPNPINTRSVQIFLSHFPKHQTRLRIKRPRVETLLSTFSTVCTQPTRDFRQFNVQSVRKKMFDARVQPSEYIKCVILKHT